MDLARQEQCSSTQTNNNNNVQDGLRGGGGLVRFRSAPSSFFAANLESADERINIMSRFLEDDLNIPDFEDDQDIKPSLNTLLNPPPNSSSSSSPSSAAFPTQLSHHTIHTTPPPQQQYKSELPPQYPRNPVRSSGGLARQCSSPAGFFNTFNNGYAPVAGMGNFRMGPGATAQVGASNSGLTYQSGLPSRMQSSSLGLLSRISEVGDEGMDGHSPTSSTCQVKPGSGDVPFFRSAYPVDSWEDSAQFLENNGNMLPGLQIDQGSRPRPLSHHLSLPKTSTELSTMEKLMQFPDSVPCKIRAKRGCATHPRSIAERVRRTRISERMRKLQELVPNMDKQTNTSDMLDLAVDHIKDLQRQFEILSEKRASCKCASQLLIGQQPY